MVYPLRCSAFARCCWAPTSGAATTPSASTRCNVAPVVHASDVAAAVLAGAQHQLPRRSRRSSAAAISTVNVALALAARPRGRRVR